MSEFRFFDALGGQLVVSSVSNPDGKPEEGAQVMLEASRLIDGDLETEWCDTNLAPRESGTLVFTMKEAVLLQSYDFATGHQCPLRDIVRWKLERGVKNVDGTFSWFLVDDRASKDYGIPNDNMEAGASRKQWIARAYLPSAPTSAPTAAPTAIPAKVDLFAVDVLDLNPAEAEAVGETGMKNIVQYGIMFLISSFISQLL